MLLDEFGRLGLLGAPFCVMETLAGDGGDWSVADGVAVRIQSTDADKERAQRILEAAGYVVTV